MKKSFILSFFLFLMLGSLMAQEGIKVGFRASPLVSWAAITNDSTKLVPAGLATNARIGFSFDFVITAGFTENFAFKTGINIVTKGVGSTQAVDVLGTSYSLNSRMNLTSLEIPLGFKFRSPEIGDGIFIIGHFGVNPELNFNNKVVSDVMSIDATTGDVSIATDVEAINVDGINLFTMAFVPGAGVDWEFDWGTLQMAATYHLGLLSYLDKDKNANQVGKISYIALNLGYFF